MYPNVYMRNVNFLRYLNDSSISEWLNTRNVLNLPDRMGDFLKFLTLYKYGGFYLNSNLIVQKCVDNLEKNSIIIDFRGEIDNSVIHLSKDGIGHEISKRILM